MPITLSLQDIRCSRIFLNIWRQQLKRIHPNSLMICVRWILVYYKGNGRPVYLKQRYTTAAAYRLMLNQFSPLPFFRLLYNIQRSVLDAMKTVRVLHNSAELSIDIILIADEIHLQASSQYHAGTYVGCKIKVTCIKASAASWSWGCKSPSPSLCCSRMFSKRRAQYYQ